MLVFAQTVTYVDRHSFCEKMFASLVILSKLLVINKKYYKKIFTNAPRLAKSVNIFFHE